MARFIYYNRNPDGKRQNDCVTRAISLASGYSYPQIRRKLYHTARLLNCEKLCVCCYRHLLDDVFKYKREISDGLTVGEFADLHSEGIYLLRVDGHITCAIRGDVFDIWDCRSEFVTDAWRVE